MEYLPVTVDKSHLITIGERLYSESIELIRELVNNAYDADATEVDIKMSDESIEVKDNGTGMDRKGLKQYFNIGSPEKIVKNKSPIYHRDLIGQFGIGKFASLSACECFEVYTQKGDFAAKVTFDKMEWEKEGDQWNLPLQVLSPDSARADGTTVTLLRLTREFEPEEVVRKIVEGTPLKAQNFVVRLNGLRITPRSLSGHRIPFLEGTDFGPVHGEIIILPSSTASPAELGIEVKVKQVTIRRELFGLGHWGKIASRIRGEVHADFLPVTTDRSNFVVDNPEYQAFRNVMDKVAQEVDDVLKRLAGRKEKHRASKALKEALQRVHRSLALNPDLSPFGAIPLAGEGEGMGGAGVLSKKSDQEAERRVQTGEEVKPGEEAKEPSTPKKTRRKLPKVKRLTPNAIVQRMKFGETGVSVCVDDFGENGSECFTEGTVIYLNRQHPLYQREAK
ncbi:MAG TPA: ATP-binding protein, partial [Thermodesulfobacteriota bacterium]|nr:ATP-binding protein [Thermodesulfobacteriota bacterium]